MAKGILQEKNDIARKLIEQNIPIEIISKTTGLGIDELNNLK